MKSLCKWISLTIVLCLLGPSISLAEDASAFLYPVSQGVMLGGTNALAMHRGYASNVAAAAMQGAGRYTLLKGEAGERAVSRLFAGTWNSVNPNLGSTARQGIDGLFLRYNKNNHPQSLMVAEVKYGSSQLGMTKDGLQGSYRWSTARLERVAFRYSAAASAASEGQFRRANRLPGVGTTTSPVRLPNGRDATVWRESRSKKWHVYSDKPFSNQDLAKGLRSHAQYFKGAADGKIDFRRVLYKVVADGDNFKISLYDIDTGKFRQSFSTSGMKQAERIAMRQSVLDAAAERLAKNNNGMSASEAQKAVNQVAKAKSLEQVLRTFDPAKPKWSWRFAHNTSLKLGGIGGVVGGVFGAMEDYRRTGTIDYSKTGVDMAIGFGINYAGGQFGSWLNSTGVRTIERAATGFGAKLQQQTVKKFAPAAVVAVTIIAISYKDCALGRISFREASFNAGTGLAIAAVSHKVGAVVGAKAAALLGAKMGGSWGSLGGPMGTAVGVFAGVAITVSVGYIMVKYTEYKTEEERSLLADCLVQYAKIAPVTALTSP